MRALLALPLVACSAFYDLDALGPGGARLPQEDGGKNAQQAVCPSERGPGMVKAGASCVDRTEVTVAHYGEFLAAHRDLPTEPSPCDWLATWTPEGWNAQLRHPDHPVVGVTWCHARAYCAWAGKRLCGRDEWLQACTRGGARPYPYGGAYVEGACPAYPSVAAAGSRSTCEGGYPGIFDMVGNVGEWTEACPTPGPSRARDGCVVMGLPQSKDDGPCKDAQELSRYWTDPSIGIRCCGS